MNYRPPIQMPARQSFTPQPQGSLRKIEETPSNFLEIAPASPRPPEMMTGVTVCKGGDLTVFDVGVWEIMLSYAYETDQPMQQLEYSVSLKAVTRFLGQDARKELVVKSVQKLREVTLNFGDSEKLDRRFVDVPMVTTWEELGKDDHRICYSFPSPIRQLMRTMPRYAYVELAALTDRAMSSKYSPALYKHLALESHGRQWQAGQANEVFVQLTPDQLADIIDFPRGSVGKLNVGKLKDFAERSIKDLQKVRRFRTSLQVIHEPGRGRTVRYFDFALKLQPPRPQLIRGARVDIAVGGSDDARYRIDSGVWSKAVKLFGRGTVFGGYIEKKFFELWLTVLKEALDKKPRSAGYEDRVFRGESLLTAIQEFGAEQAAWSFFAEEDASPDLAATTSVRDRMESQIARIERMGGKARKLKSVVAADITAEQRRKDRAAQKANADAEARVVVPVGAGGETFEECKKAIIELRGLEDLHYRNILEQIDATDWSGDRQVILRLSTPVADQRTAIKVKPTKTEWSSLLADLTPLMTTEVSYQ
ncbi:GAF domain-containing protein [Rhizobium sp. LjRoot98]|uniref:GAF domain-containing protein n=1 Tax=Rhizobium sp. LjRoot98 TaxID=3342345 RepID=UPI003ECD9863